MFTETLLEPSTLRTQCICMLRVISLLFIILGNFHLAVLGPFQKVIVTYRFVSFFSKEKQKKPATMLNWMDYL